MTTSAFIFKGVDLAGANIIIGEHPTLGLEIEGPAAVEAGIQHAARHFVERGPAASYKVKLSADLVRLSLTVDQWRALKSDFLATLASVAGVRDDYTSRFGPLIFVSNTDPIASGGQFMGDSSGSLAAAATVIGISGGDSMTLIPAGNRFLVRDDDHFEIVTTASGSTGASLNLAAGLEFAYPSTAEIWDFEWIVEQAALAESVELPGNQDGAELQRCAAVELVFVAYGRPLNA